MRAMVTDIWKPVFFFALAPHYSEHLVITKGINSNVIDCNAVIQNTKGTRKNCFRYLKLMFPLNAICTTTYLERQKCYDSDKKILFEKQWFDLEVKIPWSSLRYATHHLMVMHPHTKHHWPISKDKNVMARAEQENTI